MRPSPYQMDCAYLQAIIDYLTLNCRKGVTEIGIGLYDYVNKHVHDNTFTSYDKLFASRKRIDSILYGLHTACNIHVPFLDTIAPPLQDDDDCIVSITNLDGESNPFLTMGVFLDLEFELVLLEPREVEILDYEFDIGFILTMYFNLCSVSEMIDCISSEDLPFISGDYFKCEQTYYL